jgi:uncharacterized protein
MKLPIEDYDSCVSDLLNSPNIKSMSGFIQHGKVSCLKHSSDVSKRSYKVCRALKLDYRSAARGGLLHDYFLYDWHDSPYRLHAFRHPKISLNNAHRDFKLNEVENDIIKNHMWPLTLIPPRHAESFVVCMVDKYCTIGEVIKSKLKR